VSLSTVTLAVTKPVPAAWLSLAVMLVAAVLFTIGWRFARRRRYGQHRWVQTTAAVLNAALVVTWMIRSFVVYVAPEIPARLSQRAYAVDTVHAAVGAAGLVLGVYVVLAASKALPARLRFVRYKPWMRASYTLYMLGTVSGVILFFVAYGASFR
jgi:uncharacterized membrane protein YozB (DUF420 family)